MNNEQREAQRLLGTLQPYDSEAGFCQKVDRILQGDTKLSVRYARIGLGSTNIKTKTILLDFPEIYAQSDRDQATFVATFKGINYHELGHIAYTTCGKDEVNNFEVLEDAKKEIFSGANANGVYAIKKMNDNFPNNTAGNILNILEDCRIEGILVSKYYNIDRYFSRIVNKFIIGNLKDDIKVNRRAGINDDVYLNAWLLTYGRKFVDRGLVAKFERNIDKQNIGDKDLDAIKEIIDEYLVCNETHRQAVLAVKLTYILLKNAKANSKTSANPNSDLADDSTKAKSKVEKDVAEQVKQNIDAADNLDAQAEKDAAQEEGDVENGKPAEGTSNGQGKDNDTIEDAKETIEKISKKNDEIQRSLDKEIQDDISQIYGSGFSTEGDCGAITSVPFNPTARENVLSTKVVQLLRKLRDGMQSGYVKRQTAGSVDIEAVVNNSQNTSLDVFETYRPSIISKSRLGVTILLDQSGSMVDRDCNICLAGAWAIANALEKCNDKCSVFSYDDRFKQLKSFYARKGRWTRTGHGGTEPSDCLKETARQFKRLKRTDNITSRLLFIFTDGKWDSEYSDKIVEAMKKDGIYSVIIDLSCGPFNVSKAHRANEWHQIERVEDVERVIREVIRKYQIKLKRENRC